MFAAGGDLSKLLQTSLIMAACRGKKLPAVILRITTGGGREVLGSLWGERRSPWTRSPWTQPCDVQFSWCWMILLKWIYSRSCRRSDDDDDEDDDDDVSEEECQHQLIKLKQAPTRLQLREKQLKDRIVADRRYDATLLQIYSQTSNQLRESRDVLHTHTTSRNSR